jgi:hypothetical protein
VKTKDLFAGCFVTIAPDTDGWLVTLRKNNHETIALKRNGGLSEAIDAVRDWTLLLSDEADLGADDNALKGSAELARETLARMAVGEEAPPAVEPAEAVLRDELPAWFEREMRGE